MNAYGGWFFSGIFLVLSGCSSVQFSDNKRGTPPTPEKLNNTPVKSNTTDGAAVSVHQASNVRYRNFQDLPDVNVTYQQARKSYETGANKREAIVAIENYYKQFPNGQHVDEAAFTLGKHAFDGSDFSQAAKYYRKVSELEPPSRLRGDAIYFEALSLSQLGERKEALTALSKIDIREVNPSFRAKAFTLWGKVASDEGRWLEATLSYVKARKELPLPAPQKEVELQIEELILNRLNENELSFITREYPIEYPNASVQLKLVSLKLAQGLRSEATAILEGVIASNSPGSKSHQKASELLSRMKSLGDAQVDRVGAILPLSGRQEAVGRAVVDGLQMGIANPDSSREVEVVLGDVGPTEETAKQAFDRLVFEEKVMAIVGPPSGAQAELLSKKASDYGIPYISTSSRPGLVEKGGPFVFRLALTPERQVRALVGYAKERLNARRFAILFPQDNFGREFAAEFFKAVKDFDCEVTAAESFRSGQTDFKLPIRNMTGLSFPAFRRKESDENARLLEEKLGRKPTRNELEDILPPIVDFDVVFIPESAKTLGQIVPALTAALTGQTMPHLMGPATWKSNETLSRAGQYLENAYFVDTWSEERQSRTTKEFVEKFRIKNGSIPSVFAAQGYDIGLAIKLAYGNRGGPSGRDELRARLENLGSIDGALGIHNWDSRREALSELQLFQIKRGAFAHQGGITIKMKDK
jgi:branched-chain amino acid transport system substrate-binding protein